MGSAPDEPESPTAPYTTLAHPNKHFDNDRLAHRHACKIYQKLIPTRQPDWGTKQGDWTVITFDRIPGRSLTPLAGKSVSMQKKKTAAENSDVPTFSLDLCTPKKLHEASRKPESSTAASERKRRSRAQRSGKKPGMNSCAFTNEEKGKLRDFVPLLHRIQEKAAICIQKAYRGMLLRRRGVDLVSAATE